MMRLEGDSAVAVCSPSPSVDWSSARKKRSGSSCAMGHLRTLNNTTTSETEKKKPPSRTPSTDERPARKDPALLDEQDGEEQVQGLSSERRIANNSSKKGQSLEGFDKKEEVLERAEKQSSSQPPAPLLRESIMELMAARPLKLVVGYALTPKKTESFLQPKLLLHARKKGISFVAIDLNKSLKEQGSFDVILHKILGMKWQKQLKEYIEAHPEVVVLDPPDAIEHLHNRESMLQDVADTNLSCTGGKVRVPKQLVVANNDPSSIAESVAKAGLRLPLVAKPLIVDGTARAHALSLAYTKQSLSELDPPLVLQEFVNHGGILFKVYVVGNNIKVVRRFSLPDIKKGDCNQGLIPFPRVSCAAASADEAELDPCVGELPPQELLELLSQELRHRLGLRLFNLDMIRDHDNPNYYYVIDINYFPGFGKMPDYELVFTDFLLSLVQGKGGRNDQSKTVSS